MPSTLICSCTQQLFAPTRRGAFASDRAFWLRGGVWGSFSCWSCLWCLLAVVHTCISVCHPVQPVYEPLGVHRRAPLIFFWLTCCWARRLGWFGSWLELVGRFRYVARKSCCWCAPASHSNQCCGCVVYVSLCGLQCWAPLSGADRARCIGYVAARYSIASFVHVVVQVLSPRVVARCVCRCW